jgi:hypothetical protein
MVIDNRRLGMLLIGIFGALFIGSVICILVLN